MPRTLALRKDAGQWIAEPQKVYDLMSEALQSKQVGIQDMYFLDDPMLFLAGILRVHVNHPLYCLKSSNWLNYNYTILLGM